MQKYINEVEARDIVRVISQRKGLIFTITLITTFVVFIATLFTPAVYRAKTKLLVKEENLNSGDILPSYSTNEEFLKSQGEILQSEPIIRKALAEVSADSGKKYDEKTDIEKIRKRILVNFINQTNVIELSIEDKNPGWAAGLANRLAEEYSKDYTLRKVKLIDQALEALKAEAETSRKKLDAAENRLQGYLEEKGIAMLPESEMVAELKMFARMDTQLVEVDSDIQKIDAKLNSITREVQDKSNEELTLAFIINNPVIQNLESQIKQARIKLSRLSTEYTSEHPAIINLNKEIDELTSALAQEKEKLIASEIEACAIEKKLLESKKDVISKAQTDYTQNFSQTLANQPKLTSLRRDIDYERTALSRLLDKKQDLKMLRERTSNTRDIEIIETAPIPLKPIRPNLPLNILLGLILGLFIGSSSALLGLSPEALSFKKAGEKVSSSDRIRKTQRFQYAFDVIYSLEAQPEAEHKCSSFDINDSGIRLITDKKILQESRLNLKINIPRLSPIFLSGEVVWVHDISTLEDEKGPFSIGVKFTDTASAEHKRLEDYIYKNIEILRKHPSDIK